jgi:hypothetical protein
MRAERGRSGGWPVNRIQRPPAPEPIAKATMSSLETRI